MPRPYTSALAVLLAALAPAPGQDATAPKKFAVVVGVNEYDHPKLPALKYAENDAADLAKLLVAQGYDVVALTGAVGRVDPALAPTKVNIERRLTAALDRCRKGDIVVVALAGHGLQFQGQADAYFCPADAKPFPDEAASLVSLARVYAGLDKSFAGMKVLFVDACRDDPTATRGASRGIDADSAPKPPQGVAALFSCKAGERAFEHDDLKHGVFFHHVLEGLGGKAAVDGEVTFAGLAAYVSRRVSTGVPQLIGSGAKQSPNLKADYATEPVLALTAGASAPPRVENPPPPMPAGPDRNRVTPADEPRSSAPPLAPRAKPAAPGGTTTLVMTGTMTQGDRRYVATLTLHVAGTDVQGDVRFDDRGDLLTLPIKGTIRAGVLDAATYNGGRAWSAWRGAIDVKKGTFDGTFTPKDRSDANPTPGTLTFRKP